jgi:hypothetical protein
MVDEGALLRYCLAARSRDSLGSENHMENYKPPDLRQPEKKSSFDETFRSREAPGRPEWERPDGKTVSAKEIAERQIKEKNASAQRRKWGGRGLILLGSGALVASCPFYAFSAIGPQTIIVGLALVVAGGALLAWKPRLKDTNEALLVAISHGNYLTAPRLALEMNISFEKAERILKELVRSGIAEIDIDHPHSDNVIVYRIKGL